jgi:periplasmic protein TonB
MFNNLIESSSHARELKRRGSFLLFTTATYVVLFVITGVVSIYAYDAHLEARTAEYEITFMPVAQPESTPEAVRNTIRPASPSDNNVTRSTRVGELIDSASNPNNVPDRIGTVAPTVPPANPHSVLGSVNADPITPSGGRGVVGGTGNTPVVDLADTPPPPEPRPAPVAPKVLKISVVLNSRALFLPKPNYPPLAKSIRLQGAVNVQVMIDETGKVISAKAVSGHPILIPEAQKAAMGARFSPTTISEQPVKVSGVIIYNFIMP